MNKRKMKADLFPIIQKQLEKLTPFKLEVGERKVHTQDEKLEFFAELKNEVRIHQLPRIYELAQTNTPFLLIGGQIFPNIKEKLKEKGINWIDGAGNMYIGTDNHFLFVDHNETFHTKRGKGPCIY